VRPSHDVDDAHVKATLDADSKAWGFEVAYMVQAATKGSQDGIDTGVYESWARDMKTQFDVWVPYMWNFFTSTKLIWVAPSKGAMATGLAYVVHYCKTATVRDSVKLSSDMELPKFVVAAPLRPFLRWPDPRIEDGEGHTVDGNGEYVGKVTDPDGAVTPELDVDTTDGIATYLESLKRDIITSAGYTDLSEDFAVLGQLLDRVIGQMSASLAELLPPKTDKNPLWAVQVTKQIFTNIHALKTFIWDFQWIDPSKRGMTAQAGGIIMIGDPVLATWMFPTAWSSASQSTEVIDPTTMRWIVPLPGPLALIHADWNTISKASEDDSLVAIRDSMAGRFGDGPRGRDFGGTVPFFTNLEVYVDATVDPVNPAFLLTAIPVQFDDWEYVLPELSSVGGFLRPRTDQRFRVKFHKTDRWDGFMFAIKQTQAKGTAIKVKAQVQTWNHVSLIKNEEGAFVSWMMGRFGGMPDGEHSFPISVDLDIKQKPDTGDEDPHILLRWRHEIEDTEQRLWPVSAWELRPLYTDKMPLLKRFMDIYTALKE